MDLDEIQSVQSRERQTDSLQQLRDSFYEEAGEFVRALREERERAAERADDPFDAPEVNRLSDDIATAEQTLEAIYERRVGKIVKMASLAAADMPTEDEGLTTEERDLFESLVGAIENNRDHVFDVLEGTAVDGDQPGMDESDGTDVNNREPPAAEQSRPDPVATDAAGAETADDTGAEDRSDDETVSAADLMGPDDPSTPQQSSGASGEDDQSRPAPPDPAVAAATEEQARRDGGSPATAEPSGSDAVDEPTNPESAADEESTVARATVRITDDVGEILGVDDRAYDLSTDDIVTLPETNADPLIQRGAAERLE